ncbi:MAG: N-acetylmuramoyl-L-alanine amidase [Eubacteriales bacterium]|jgi:N-acetylmuramoyl-L-alanine amidase
MKVFVAKGSNPLSPRVPAGTGRQDINLSPISEHLITILTSSGIEAVGQYAGEPPDSIIEDSFTSRIYEANIQGADYFIYLCTNASYSPFETGASAVIAKPDSYARALGESILESLKTFAGLQNRGVLARPGLHVLQRADMPALLVETGYRTNEGDAALMREHPELVARGIANGILTYLQDLLPDKEEDCFFACPHPFYQLYPEARTGSCDLGLHVFAGKKRQPVQRADVTVYQRCGERHIMVYRGLTDKSGRAIPVELPLNCRDPQPSQFCICVRHPGYLPLNHWLEVKDDESLQLNLELEARHQRRLG